MSISKHIFITSVLILIFFSACSNKEDRVDVKIKPTEEISSIGIHFNEMNLDTISPILDLINSLEHNQELHETGKAYWIGYNDLMYSIALHGEEAIDPLLNFIDTIREEDAKIAAIYTIHLIGIDCKVQGRTYEEFNNLKARKALFHLLEEQAHLEQNYLQPLIMDLLVRDAWFSDIPTLMDILEKSENDLWAISSAFQNYFCFSHLELPININLTEDMLRYYIREKRKANGYSEKEFYELVFSSFKEKYHDQIFIEDNLHSYDFHCRLLLNGNITSRLSNRIVHASGEGEFYLNIDILLDPMPLEYFIKRDNLFYTVDGNKLYIFSAETAKKMWLSWWILKSESYKDFLKRSNISSRRILRNKINHSMTKEMQEIYKFMQFQF